MAKTGAKSSAELSTRAVYVRPLERLRPPADLSEEGRQLFLDLVLGCEATAFRASDAPLLSAYVRAVEMERAASAHLETEGHVIDGKPSPWLAVLAQALKGMATLSHRLRLSLQGRSPTNPKRPPSVSYYRAAMKLAIEQMRKESPESRAHVDRVLREEGFESAGYTASYHLQCRALRLRPWQAAPVYTDVEIDPDCCGGRPEEIALLQRMLSLGISAFHPDPLRAIAEAERAEAEAEPEAAKSEDATEPSPAEPVA
jgi:hypothetical protein